MARVLSRWVLALTFTAVVGACGGADDPVDPPPAGSAGSGVATTAALATTTPAPTPARTPATTAPATLIEFADAHLAFVVALPDEHAVVGSGTDDFVGDGSCVWYWWHLSGGVTVEAWPASCDPANSEPGNGLYGHYRTLADAPGLIATGAADTVLGPATLGEQVYYQCTNSCIEWPLDIAVIELSEPVDHEYPTLTVIATHPEATADDLRALLEAFGAG